MCKHSIPTILTIRRMLQSISFNIDVTTYTRYAWGWETTPPFFKLLSKGMPNGREVCEQMVSKWNGKKPPPQSINHKIVRRPLSWWPACEGRECLCAVSALFTRALPHYIMHHHHNGTYRVADLSETLTKSSHNTLKSDYFLPDQILKIYTHWPFVRNPGNFAAATEAKLSRVSSSGSGRVPRSGGCQPHSAQCTED